MVLDLASRRRGVDSPVVSLDSVRDAAEVLVLVTWDSLLCYFACFDCFDLSSPMACFSCFDYFDCFDLIPANCAFSTCSFDRFDCFGALIPKCFDSRISRVEHFGCFDCFDWAKIIHFGCFECLDCFDLDQVNFCSIRTLTLWCLFDC